MKGQIHRVSFFFFSFFVCLCQSRISKILSLFIRKIIIKECATLLLDIIMDAGSIPNVLERRQGFPANTTFPREYF